MRYDRMRHGVRHLLTVTTATLVSPTPLVALMPTTPLVLSQLTTTLHSA